MRRDEAITSDTTIIQMPIITDARTAKSATAPDDLDDGLEYEIASSDEGEMVALSDGEDLAAQAESDDNQSEIRSKKRKPKQNDKLHEKKRQKMEYDMEKKKELSSESSDMIAEKFASKISSAYPDLSPIELSQKYVDKKYIKSTSSFSKTRSLDNMESFIKDNFGSMLDAKKRKKKKNPKRQDKVAKELAKKAAAEGAVESDVTQFVVVLSMSAIRACDVNRATRELGSIKLIKKNKVKDDLNILATTPKRVVATTPGRLIKLLNEKESTITEQNLTKIVLDNSYLDSKKQNVLDVQDTLVLLRRIIDNNSHTEIYLY